MNTDLSKLKRGDWISFKYGFGSLDWVVLENFPEQNAVRIVPQGWCVSSSRTFCYEELNNSYHGRVIKIGKGRYRWWRWILFPFLDVICPYSKP